MFLIKFVLLFSPLVNPIIWTDRQTFDNSEIPCAYLVYDPSALEETSPSGSGVSQMRRMAIPNPVVEIPPVETQKIFYLQKRGNQSLTETWTLNIFPDQIVAINHTSDYISQACYTKDWQLKHLSITDPNHQYEARVKDSTLYVKIDREETEEFQLEDGYPWIQQITFGMRQFILATEQQSLDFYGYIPNPINSTIHLIAEKKEEKEIPGFGKCVKVHFYPYRWLLQRFGDIVAWYDTKNGDLIRMETRVTLLPTTTLELQR